MTHDAYWNRRTSTDKQIVEQSEQSLKFHSIVYWVWCHYEKSVWIQMVIDYWNQLIGWQTRTYDFGRKIHVFGLRFCITWANEENGRAMNMTSLWQTDRKTDKKTHKKLTFLQLKLHWNFRNRKYLGKIIWLLASAFIRWQIARECKYVDM